MNISKLNQLDRIEYRQVSQEIEKTYNISSVVSICLIMIKFLIFMLAYDLIMYYLSGSFFFTDYYQIISKVFLIFIVVAFGIDFYSYFMLNKEKRNLYNEFFTTEIKPKGGSNGKRS